MRRLYPLPAAPGAARGPRALRRLTPALFFGPYVRAALRRVVPAPMLGFRQSATLKKALGGKRALLTGAGELALRELAADPRIEPTALRWALLGAVDDYVADLLPGARPDVTTAGQTEERTNGALNAVQWCGGSPAEQIAAAEAQLWATWDLVRALRAEQHRPALRVA